jgi:hypothetical protein
LVVVVLVDVEVVAIEPPLLFANSRSEKELESESRVLEVLCDDCVCGLFDSLAWIADGNCDGFSDARFVGVLCTNRAADVEGDIWPSAWVVGDCSECD